MAAKLHIALPNACLFCEYQQPRRSNAAGQRPDVNPSVPPARLDAPILLRGYPLTHWIWDTVMVVFCLAVALSPLLLGGDF